MLDLESSPVGGEKENRRTCCAAGYVQGWEL